MPTRRRASAFLIRILLMWISLLLFSVIFGAIPSAMAQPQLFPQPLSPRIANYDIDVSLDTKIRTLRGHEIVKWKNSSPDPISELHLHLYMNAFRNNKSTFMKEASGPPRGGKIEKDSWGYIEVRKIGLSSGADLTGAMQFIHPDDDNADDKTVIRLPLPKPVLQGDSVSLTVDFVEKLPQPPLARTGAKEEYFFVGQWFPKMGVYIDGKWNCHQFHANSEFFADFGVYNVHMTVPEKNIVGATGVQVEVKNNGDGTATHFYHAEDVHDFAWTTSPEFIEFTGETKGVKIRVLMQPDHADQGTRHVEAAKTAINYFHNWYGDYPFPNLTVVDPRRGALGSGGMEYPTLITVGTVYGLPDGLRLVELAIIHEFGHNYWYHLLASNEFEESWMDEGINTYTEIQIMHDAYGSPGDGIDVAGVKLDDIQIQRAGYIGNPDLDPTVRYAWQYYSGGSYGVNSYNKPGLLLTTLQNYLGKESMRKIMRTYVERWRFKHPKSRDFVAVANDVARQNLDWFFDQALLSNAVLDYSVDQLKTTLVPRNSGFDYTRSPGGSDTTLQSENPADEDIPDSLKLYHSIVKVRRLGAFTFPVELQVVFEKGDTITERWDGKDFWKRYDYTRPSRLVSATVDPYQKIPLDVNFTNNSKTVEPRSMGVNKLAIRFLFWMQFTFDQPDFLNLSTVLSGVF